MRVEADGVIDLLLGLLCCLRAAAALEVHDVGDEDVAVGVLIVACDDFVRQPRGLCQELIVLLLAVGVQVAVGELDARLRVVRVELDGALELFDELAAAPQLLVGLREPPVRRRQVIVNLEGVAELDGGLLPAALLEELFAAAQVLGLRFFRAGAGRRERDEQGEKEDGQRPETPGTRALLKIHLSGTPSGQTASPKGNANRGNGRALAGLPLRLEDRPRRPFGGGQSRVRRACGQNLN